MACQVLLVPCSVRCLITQEKVRLKRLGLSASAASIKTAPLASVSVMRASWDQFECQHVQHRTEEGQDLSVQPSKHLENIGEKPAAMRPYIRMVRTIVANKGPSRDRVLKRMRLHKRSCRQHPTDVLSKTIYPAHGLVVWCARHHLPWILILHLLSFGIGNSDEHSPTTMLQVRSQLALRVASLRSQQLRGTPGTFALVKRAGKKPSTTSLREGLARAETHLCRGPTDRGMARNLRISSLHCSSSSSCTNLGVHASSCRMAAVERTCTKRTTRPISTKVRSTRYSYCADSSSAAGIVG